MLFASLVLTCALVRACRNSSLLITPCCPTMITDAEDSSVDVFSFSSSSSAGDFIRSRGRGDKVGLHLNGSRSDESPFRSFCFSNSSRKSSTSVSRSGSDSSSCVSSIGTIVFPPVLGCPASASRAAVRSVAAAAAAAGRGATSLKAMEES